MWIIGLCNYSKDIAEEKRIYNCKKSISKPIKIIKNGELINIFNSRSDLAKQFKSLFGVYLDPVSINKVCRGELKDYKGFQFENL